MSLPIPAEAMRALLRPASVAILGATPGAGRGGWIHEQLLRMGYDGAIYPVNPKYEQIRGARAFPSLAAIPAPVEFVAVCLRAEQAVRAIEECAAKGARAALFVASGFAEAGPEGQAIQAELRRVALGAGIAVCGPNCYGVANLHGRFAAYGGALAEPLRPGPVALLFQSGALTHAAMDPAAARASGYSYVITTGNEAVVELADYVAALADDPHTRVIACFVEGLASPARFFAAARLAIGRGKRLVVLKTGRSELARRAALAHTGALTGPDDVYDALFRQLGVARVADMDELIETAELLAAGGAPEGAAAIVSISGGSCGVAADLAQAAGLPLAQLAEGTAARLRALLPPFATPNNPLDLTGAIGERPDLLPGALAALCADPGVGSVALAINTPIGGDAASRALYQSMCRALADSAAAHGAVQHLAFSISSGQYDPEIVAAMRAAGVPLLMGAREAILAMAHWRRSAARPDDPAELAGPPLGLAAELAGAAGPAALGERGSRAVLAAAGLTLCREAHAASAAEAARAAEQIGFPVALKISSPDIAHKTEVGGVALNLRSRPEVERAFYALVDGARRGRPDARIEGVLVQELVAGGLETLVGVTNEPELGPVVVFGLGGVFVEALRDWSMRAAPVDEAGARAMIAETRAAALLAGWRGGPPLDEGALARAIALVSRLAWQLREQIDSIDINPLIVLPDGQGVRAVDALIVRRGARAAAAAPAEGATR